MTTSYQSNEARPAPRWRLSLGAAVAVAALASVAIAGRPGTLLRGRQLSPVIYPAQNRPLQFNHAQHISEHGLACDECHRAERSRSSLDNLLPTEGACSDCHEIDRREVAREVESGEPPARCDACHRGFSATSPVTRIALPPPNIKFNHSLHLSKKIDCRRCHGDLVADGVAVAGRERLPPMATCLVCHDESIAPKRCTHCHLARAGGYVQTELPEGLLRPSGSLRGAAHDLGFRSSHRAAARNDPSYCANCHRKESCVECHNGVVKPMAFHGNDYVELHAIDARRNNPDCSACHRTQSFCVGCHSRAGITADTRTSEFVPRSSGSTSPRLYHPAGWVGFASGQPTRNSRGRDHHSFEAQRNMRQCVSCHREQFCQSCHSAQKSSFGVSPHPRGWRNSRRCESLVKRAGRVCLRCHVDMREARCDYIALGR